MFIEELSAIVGVINIVGSSHEDLYMHRFHSWYCWKSIATLCAWCKFHTPGQCL